MLTRICLKPNGGIRGSGYDLSTYFSQLREHPTGLDRQCVGRFFLGDLYTEYGCRPGRLYCLALTSLGMGDVNATDVAQETHLEILNDQNCVYHDGLLRYGRPFPSTSLLQGIYIDDGGIMKILPLVDIRKPSDDTLLVTRSLGALSLSGLEIANHKGFGSARAVEAHEETPVGDEVFTMWGTEVASRPGLVGTPPSKRLAISCLLWQVVLLPTIERQVFERCLSLVIHPFSHRKEFMSFLHRSYRWAKTLTYGTIVDWAPDIRSELFVVSLLVLIAQAHIRWPVSTQITATDATPSRGGAVSSTVSRELAHALYMTAELRGSTTTLRRDILPSLDSIDDPGVETFFKCADWKVISDHDFPETHHVNLQEIGEIGHTLETLYILSSVSIVNKLLK